MARTLKNSEYRFWLGKVKLTLYLNYQDKTFSICEDGQEGVFYGECSDITEGFCKAQLCTEIMEFIEEEFKETDKQEISCVKR